ncbi:hypothetical protein PIROE2DRAFT_13540, partial [Piromyces sp. E2]
NDEVKGENIVLNAVAYSDNEHNEIYSSIINDFNEYSEENNLNITININVHTNADYTNFESFANSVESLLLKKTNKYDIYYYDNAYTVKYGPHLLDLKKHLPKEHIEMYNADVLEKTCVYENKLVGLPFNLAFTLLYSNYILLDKYNKTIPKTWDELKSTSKYIKEQENNPDLITYNGLLDESENGICSIYEFIYSFRDSVDSPFPDIRSDTTVKALKYLKNMKDEIASNDIFRSDVTYGLTSLLEGKAIFAKFYTLTYSLLDIIPYKISILPGFKEGISGGIIVGYNIGIDGSIPKEKLEACITAFKFLSSKELQKKYFLIENLISGITSLYDDEEVCEKAKCEIIKQVQFINRPSSKYYHFSNYIQKIEKNIYKYLYDDEPVEKVLEKIEDLTRIHNVSFTERDSNYEFALSIFIFVVTLSFIMAGSIYLLFVEKFEQFFGYMPKDSWIILVYGLIILISNCYTTFGPVTSAKCHLYVVLLVLGYTLNIMPVLFQLIINSPEQNKITRWICQHKYYFFILFTLSDVIIISFFGINIFDVELIMIDEGKNFETCKLRNAFVMYAFRLFLPFYQMKNNNMNDFKISSITTGSKSIMSKNTNNTNNSNNTNNTYNKRRRLLLKLSEYHNQSIESSLNNYTSNTSSNYNTTVSKFTSIAYKC